MIAARQIAFGKAAGKPYKARLEYIESTGTQYIDTGIFLNTITDSIKARVFSFSIESKPSDTYLYYFGTYCKVDEVIRYIAYRRNVNNAQLFLYPTGEGFSYALTERAADQWCNIEWEATSVKDNTNTYPCTGLVDTVFSTSLCLFAIKTFYNTTDRAISTRCSSFSVTRNGEKILDLIPVLDNDFVPCMYDEVSGEFFYNQGEGEFIAGPEITEE